MTHAPRFPRPTWQPSAVWLLALPFMAGCAGGSGPSTPNGASAPTIPPGIATPSDPNTGLVAEFVATLDPSAGTIAIEPVTREGSAIGDTFSEVGLTPAFTGQFGTHFWADAVRWNGTDVEVDFATRHPFQPDKRPDLGIFNMKLWVGTELAGVTVAGIHGVPDLVTNADGHSDMWNLTASQGIPGGAPYQPYVIIHEDPTSAPFDFQAPAGWNVLFPGQSSIDTVALDLSSVPPGQITLHLYLTADYGQSAVRATRQSPAYELPKFAGNAPWKVSVTQIANNLIEGNTSSSADFQLDIWDWKHGQSLGSDVSGAQVFVPDFVAAPITATLSGTGTDPTPLTASIIVPNTLDPGEGDYWGVVAVSDAASGVALKDDLVTPVTVTYATYQWFPLHVDAIPADPPTAVMSRCRGGSPSAGVGDRFDGSASTPGSNPITSYEWDFDYIAPTFDVEATGQLVSHAFPVAGTFIVALRVSDGISTPSIATESITVTGAATWSTTTRLTSGNSFYERTAGTYCDVSNSLTTGPDGVLHLVYSQQNGSNAEVYHMTYGGCPPAWSSAQLIANSPSLFWSYNTSVVVTPDNTTYASFVHGATFAQYGYASKTATGSWTTQSPITVQPPVSNGYWTAGYLATSGATGKVGFCGTFNPGPSQVCVGTPSPQARTFFSEFVSGAWTPQLQIGDASTIISSGGSPCGSYSQVFIRSSFTGTNTGEWVAVWASLAQVHNGVSPLSPSGQMNLEWNTTTGGTWNPADSILYAGGTQYNNPVLATAPNGTIWLVTSRSPSADLLAATYSGGSWSAALTPLAMPAASLSANLAFSPSGRGMLVGGGGSNLIARAFDQTDTPAGLAAVANVSASVTGSNHMNPVITGPGDNRFMSLWVTDRYGGGPFTGRELEWAELQ